MPSYRFPVLVWTHATGDAVTACLVEDPKNIAAIAVTRSTAVSQLKDMLQWLYRQQPYTRKPNFTDPELSWIKVEVRPEYRAEDRLFPCRETVMLRLPCVRGKDLSGLLLCALPTLGIRFHFDSETSLPQLASHYVQLALKGLTPQQLARQLPPPSAELEDVVIQVRLDAVEADPPVDLDPLPQIAEPLGARGGRGRLSRPWQRDEQVARLVEILSTQQGSVLLLGESGSGKSAVLAEAARKVERTASDLADQSTKAGAQTRAGAQNGIGDLSEDDSEEAVKKPRNRFWLTNASRLIAGMKYLGQWQEQCEQAISKLGQIGGVLCVEHLLDLVKTAGAAPDQSVAAFLIPYLQRGELRLVSEATVEELDACRRLLPSFAAVFTVVEVPVFSHRQAVEALDQLARSYSQNLKVNCDRAAIEQVCRLFGRFMPYQSFPGPAASFITGLFDRLSRTPGNAMTVESVVDRMIQLTGLPEMFLRDARVMHLDQVVDTFRNRVIGQNSACQTAAGYITTFKAGMNDPGRPLGVLLFCGPTGVGKTELARTMSDFLFGHGEKKDRLVRLDMSEYAGPGAVERLIGSPIGEPSEMIKRLRQQPFTVILLDEIEKASPEVFDLLLGVFDEGRLTDRFGRLTTFRSAIIVMTSNLGANISEPFGLSRQPSSGYDSEVAFFFRPEFFNRIDAVVNFNPLDEESIKQIATAELQKIEQREGVSQRKLKLKWTPDVLDLICKNGYDARYGARPLQRAIETGVVTPLAKFLVTHPTLNNATVLLSLNSSQQVNFEIAT